MAKKRKTIKKVVKKFKTKGRCKSSNSKEAKVKKLIKLAKLKARRKPKKSFLSRLFGR